MTHPATAQPAPIKVSGPAGLASVIPAMLGFHPESSAVMVCLSTTTDRTIGATRTAVGPVARVDLPQGKRQDRATAANLAETAARHADAVILAIYMPADRFTANGAPPFLASLTAALGAAGVPVTDAIIVTDVGIFPADAASLSPSVALPTTDDPTARELAAAMAMSGRSTLPTRAAMAASIAAPQPPAADHLARSHAAARPLPAETAGEAVDDLLTRAGRGALTVGQLAALAATFAPAADPRHAFRDGIMADAATDYAAPVAARRPFVPLLVATLATLPREHPATPDVAGALAVCAYLAGDGGLANAAIDRAIEADPDHPLAHLVMAAITCAITPQALARVMGGGGATAEPTT